MGKSISEEARELAEALRELLDRSTPGTWRGVHGRDNQLDRGGGYAGAIVSEFASGKVTIGEGLSAADKALVLFARRHQGRIADLLERLAELAGDEPPTPSPEPAAGPASPPAMIPIELASPPAPEPPPPPTPAPPSVPLHEGDVEIDLSMLEGDDLEEIEETLRHFRLPDEEK